MFNIYYQIPTTDKSIVLTPTDGAIQVLQTEDATINNNFRTLYEVLKSKQHDLQFLDLVHIVGYITDSSTVTSMVAQLLPGEALVIQTERTISYAGVEYQYGDFLLRLENQSIQRIRGNNPLGYLPFLNSINYNPSAENPTATGNISLYYYTTSTPDELFTKVIIDYTNTTPTYQGVDGSTTLKNLSFNDGVFHSDDYNRDLALVPQYEYKYKAQNPSHSLCLSEELNDSNSYTVSQTVAENEYYGIVKLYLEQDGSFTEVANGLFVTQSGSTITWTLKTGLQSLANVKWWLEVK